ncbi:MAG: hpch/hpai aldolase [Alphaproteobacteria bacterium]|nr:hpch/hpai aldolase [Alphaproteobacteria bacterium]
MTRNALKQMTRTREVKLGHFIVEFVTPGIGHILKAAGCDFVFFDMEHSGFSFETLKSAIRYFEAADLPVIVRVPAQENDMLARACDMGAEGLIAPMISTVAQAQAMVDSVKYYPQGKRGVGLGMAHDNYRTAPVAEALAGANDRTTVICLIETAEGAENAEAIAALDGVDCLWVGHFDLSVSLGIPGQFDHPEFQSAMDKIIAGAKKHGKSLGRLVPNTDQGISFYKQGFDFCCYSGDVWVLRDALGAAMTTLREGCK